MPSSARRCCLSKPAALKCGGQVGAYAGFCSNFTQRSMRQQGELFRLLYRDQTCFRLNLRSLLLSQKPAGAMHSRVVSLLAASVLGTLLYGATGRGLQQQSAAGPASEAGTPSKLGGGETQPGRPPVCDPPLASASPSSGSN